MKLNKVAPIVAFTFFLMSSVSGLAQISPKDINGARNSAAEGTDFDTNVSFTLRMTLSGEDIPLTSASIGQDVSIVTTIRPETEDIGSLADIIIVDYLPPSLSIRNSDGNFVSWNGSLKNLTAYLEDFTLAAEQDVEVFSGQLGSTGNHRIFVGFVVNEFLYFTPSALRFDIEEAQQSAQELAIDLFNTTISPDIVQDRCFVCHRNGSVADGESLQLFVATSDSDHLSKNFTQFENLHGAKGTQYILDKVRNLNAHGGGTVLPDGSAGFNDLSEFLDLLDQASE